MAKKDFDRIREKITILIKETVEIAIHSEAEELVCLADFFSDHKNKFRFL